jgi:hypothetical protein
MKKVILLVIVLLLVASTSLFAAQQFMMSFINHTDVQLHFYVDGSWVCTANAGMICYSTVHVGPHDFGAVGPGINQQTTATLFENADNPNWVICYTTNGVCN